MKKAAFGTRLRYHDQDNSLHVIHYVADISGPEVSVEPVDVTTHDSQDAFDESLPGLASGGDVSFDLMFDSGPAGHDRILELIEAREVINFDLLMPRPDVEFITGGGMSSGGDWTATGDWTITGGEASCTSISMVNDHIEQSVTGLIEGENYRLTLEFSAPGEGGLRILLDGQEVGRDIEPEGVRSIVFRAPSDSGLFRIERYTQPAEFHIGNISLIGINEDAEERFDFVGIFTKAGILAPVKDALKASVSIKVSGRPSYAVAS